MEENKYHFDVTPHIVKQLGEQLVSDEITALLEIIKNSYDADASYVSIEINTSGQYTKENLIYSDHKGFIVIEDDGCGMDEQTILKSWLTISYSQKRGVNNLKVKSKQGRTPLGEKGLGRLSTQRLANICEIFTSTEKGSGTHIAFDWRDFDEVERLSSVKVIKESYTSSKRGTKLILTDINQPQVWQGQNLEAFKGKLAQIISPYEENKPFEVFISVNNQNIDLIGAQKDLQDLALSRFEFVFTGDNLIISGKTKLEKFIGNKKDDYIDFLVVDNGNKFFNYLKDNKKYNFIKKSKEDNFFIEFSRNFSFTNDIPNIEILNGEKANPGSFEGKIDEFTYDNWLSSDERVINIFGKLAGYREFAQNQAGIKIFRNGFAVIPFGIDKEDWLRLGDAQTTGQSYYQLRPVNVIGYFAIDEGENLNLKDQTDRKGFISNEYSRNFFVLSFFIRDEINRYQEFIRRAYNDFLSTYKVENSGIKTVTQAFNELKITKARGEDIRKEFIESKDTVSKLIPQLKNTAKEIQENPLFSTELEKETALKVGELLNELLKIQSTQNKLDEVIKKTENLNQVIDILEPKIELLENQLENFSELASLGLTTESVSHEFASIADRLSEKSAFYSSKLRSKNLTASDINVLMEYINSTVNGLKIQLKHLDPALKYNKEKKSILSVSKLFEEEKEYYLNRFNKNNIDFSIITLNDFFIKINKGKIIQIIDNLLNNSEFWLIEKKLNDKNFKAQIQIRIEKPWIYISDNGYGIAPAVENQLFEPFVTTKPKGRGRGLGLFIVQQLLDSSGCSIILEPEKNELNRKYIFAINLSNIVE
ncbi:ATP-binding protein [Flavobacterium ginsengisoli]|uniref:histidine kinase n=1 Tax=Flavobacterium ginsengisoli TaxID=871694 RepID=A0ABP7FAF3_9FLAO|nr:sensor histidine kinase [Flavobacterium ginsengisoli]